jgi:hypothetical protein
VILSFSLCDYSSIDGKKVSDFAKDVSCPVFIASAKNEQESWQSIYDNLLLKEKSFFLPDIRAIMVQRLCGKRMMDIWNIGRLLRVF